MTLPRKKTVVIDVAPVLPVNGAPILAHWAPRNSPTIALCGKRLIGERAPHDAPTCIVCEDLRHGGPDA